MMAGSVEGLWLLYIGDVYKNAVTPGTGSAGVVVLDSQRLYGGDSAFFWTGRFEMGHAGSMRATAKVSHYNGSKESVFGFPFDEADIEMVAVRVDDRVMRATVQIKGHEPASIQALLVLATELP